MPNTQLAKLAKQLKVPVTELLSILWSEYGVDLQAGDSLPEDIAAGFLALVSRDSFNPVKLRSQQFKQVSISGWRDFLSLFEIGHLVEGRVTRRVGFGAFVELAPGIEGLVHRSEFGAEPPEVKQSYKFRIISASAAERKIGLSAREALVHSEPTERMQSDFDVYFSPDLTPSEIKSLLTVLANYYRACGGIGFQVEFEAQEVQVGELIGA